MLICNFSYRPHEGPAKISGNVQKILATTTQTELRMAAGSLPVSVTILQPKMIPLPGFCKIFL